MGWSLRLGGMNVGVRGIVYDMDIVKLRTIMQERRVDVLGVGEHWRGEKDRMRQQLGVKQTVEEREEEERLLGEEFVWVSKHRKEGSRGGVGLVVRKPCRVEVIEAISSERMLWARITNPAGVEIVVGSVYFSSNSMADGERLGELVIALEHLRGEESIALVGDVNGRIGQRGSVVGGGRGREEERGPEVEPAGVRHGGEKRRGRRHERESNVQG